MQKRGRTVRIIFLALGPTRPADEGNLFGGATLKASIRRLLWALVAVSRKTRAASGGRPALVSRRRQAFSSTAVAAGVCA